MDADNNEARQHFLGKIKKYIGYLGYSRSQDGFEDSGWELRFAIKPEKKNLKKAARVAAKILLTAEHKYDFKCFLLQDKDKSFADLGLEGPYFKDTDPETPRDQRGKEFCLYLRQKEGGVDYEKTPEEFKQLLLRLWKGFLDVGVELGYMPGPPIGDKSLRVMKGDVEIITPISYFHSLEPETWSQIKKEYNQGIEAIKKGSHKRSDYLSSMNHTQEKPFSGNKYLSDDFYQEDNFLPGKNTKDPLSGVQITLRDLTRQGISTASLEKMHKARIAYLREHISRAEEVIKKEFADLPESPVNDHSFKKILALLKELQEKVTSKDDDDKRRTLLSNIKKIFPPDPLSLEWPEFLIGEKLLRDTDAIARAITYVTETALENAIKNCYPHYLDRASSMISKEQWDAWALKEPKKMVILAARLREIEKEKVGLATEKRSQYQLSRIFHPLSNLLLELLPRVGGVVVILLVIPFVPSMLLAGLIFEAPVIGSILWYLAFWGLILVSPALAALTGLSAVTITTIGLIVLILPLVFLGFSVLGAESRGNSDIPTSSGKKTDEHSTLNPAPVSSSALAPASEKTPRSSNFSRFCSFVAECLQVREKQDETEKDLSPRSSTSGKKSE